MTVFATTNPAIVVSSRRRRGQRAVARLSGIAATIAPIAKTVTVCPAALADTPRSAPSAGSTPAGSTSVRSVTNPVAARASRGSRGKRVPDGGASAGASVRSGSVVVRGAGGAADVGGPAGVASAPGETDAVDVGGASVDDSVGVVHVVIGLA